MANILDKIKGCLTGKSNNAVKADSVIDKTVDFVDSKVDDKHDDKIETVKEKAKEVVDKLDK